jgi:HEPN domain-containing protein
VEHSIQFPKTHDLVLLLDLVADIDVSFGESLEEVAELNPYGVDARYPGDIPEVTEDEARRAISLARQGRDAVRGELKRNQ